mmetsp:Transcript_37693/g.91554  ORF Transcript_37693/g.91554 Transcript_37693/m.91554 type:complete len:105 (+) Transcript_37693:452-766(+)
MGARHLGSGIRIRVDDHQGDCSMDHCVGIDTSHNTEFTGCFDKDASVIYNIKHHTVYQRRIGLLSAWNDMFASILGAAGNDGNCSVGIATNVTAIVILCCLHNS